MIKHDGGDLLVYLIGFVVVVLLVCAVIFVVGMFIAAIGAVVGVVGAGYGGGVSIRNYGKSFKKNVIDSIKNYANN